MRRVASRQRLFSWDQFDATADSSSTSDDESDYATCHSISNSGSYSRNTSFLSLRPYDDDDDNDDDNDDDTCDGGGYARLDTNVIVSNSGQHHIPSVALLPSQPQTPSLINEIDKHPLKKGGKLYNGVKKSVSFSNFVTSSREAVKNDQVTSMTNTTLLKLNQDTQLDILSFLNVEGVQSIGITCHYFHNLLVVDSTLPEDQTASVSRNNIWWSLMLQKWPYLSLLSNARSCYDNADENTRSNHPVIKATPQKIIFSDNRKHSLPFLFGGSNPPHAPSAKKLYFGALLNHAPIEESCTRVDPRFYAIPPERVNVVQNPNLRRMTETKRKVFRCYEMKIKPMGESVEVMQFIGSVGVGDRSILSNKPFPRPLESFPVFKKPAPPEPNVDEVEDTNDVDGVYNSGDGIENRRRKRKGRRTLSFSKTRTSVSSPTHVLRNMLERGRKCRARYLCAAAAAVERTSMRKVFHNMSTETRSVPFVSPFMVQSTYNERYYEIDLTPRMVAYFEVSIIKRDSAQEPQSHEDSDDTDTQGIMGRRRHVAECIAVGVTASSSNSTLSYSRMPGWDSNSYGYHGDDGGIFHSRGDMIRIYGPKYGHGDTVGCGVNYENGGIFFTLNGNFLGYAWSKLPLVQEGQTELFPTVGVDSNCPVVCNFGNTRPFMFDLAMFVATKGSVCPRIRNL